MGGFDSESSFDRGYIIEIGVIYSFEISFVRQGHSFQPRMLDTAF